MSLPFYNWSRTAASNATADSTVNWAEGMAPSAVNDSARAMMASTAAFRDDIAGATVTGGTSTAYTLTTYQGFDTLAHLHGQVVAFTPHATNTGACTLNVDGLGVRFLRVNSSADLTSGVLVQGTPYAAVYNNNDAAFYLFGVGLNPGIPLGSSIDYWGSSAPTTAFALAYGQAISRSTYSLLFSLLGTAYGSGDGSTTFNLPDLRGRIIAGKDDMGGTAASRLTSSYFGASAAALGAVGGAENTTLTAAQIPTINSSITANLSVSVTSTNYIASNPLSASAVSASAGGSGLAVVSTGGSVGQVTSTGSTSGTGSVVSTNTSGNAHRTVQPTIIANKLIRIL